MGRDQTSKVISLWLRNLFHIPASFHVYIPTRMAFDLNRVMAEDFLQVSESKWLWLLMDTCLDLDLMDI